MGSKEDPSDSKVGEQPAAVTHEPFELSAFSPTLEIERKSLVDLISALFVFLALQLYYAHSLCVSICWSFLVSHPSVCKEKTHDSLSFRQQWDYYIDYLF